MGDLTNEVAHVSRLLKAGLGLGGADLTAQLRRGGRLLPRRVRAAAGRLAAAQAMLGQPKLARQLDLGGLQKDAQLCLRYLTPLVQQRVRHGLILRMASWGALIVVICAAVVYGVWRIGAL